MNKPLVSVICLCFNHSKFVEEAIRSVQDQTYPNVELIILDDHSEDQSVEVIQRILPRLTNAKFIPIQNNLGNCRAFNKGLEVASGEFIIDLSADDVLLPERIEEGVTAFQNASVDAGVNFCDAELINAEGKSLGRHSDRFPHNSIPQGDIYAAILRKYFINSPTMMMKRMVFDRLGGYDESLAYEDFDFLVRSSRQFKFIYTPEVLLKRRILSTSLGSHQYKRGSRQLESTFKICEKAFLLNRTDEEYSALKMRIRYELRQALLLGDIKLALNYFRLLLR
ncbi:MAG: glycosyltransferase [Cyclobacteriaceae bacterium]|nr:glycosyltransferase [Cyclobacteriaceae bacterium]